MWDLSTIYRSRTSQAQASRGTTTLCNSIPHEIYRRTDTHRPGHYVGHCLMVGGRWTCMGQNCMQLPHPWSSPVTVPYRTMLRHHLLVPIAPYDLQWRVHVIGQPALEATAACLPTASRMLKKGHTAAALPKEKSCKAQWACGGTRHEHFSAHLHSMDATARSLGSAMPTWRVRHAHAMPSLKPACDTDSMDIHLPRSGARRSE